MGLKEQIVSGASALKRETINIPISGGTIPSTPRRTGSAALGNTFVLTTIQATTRCRIRLYGDSGSRNDATELARPFNSQSIPSAIGLIADINLDDESLVRIVPAIYGMNLDNPAASAIYWTVDSGSAFLLSSTDKISVTRFLLEDPAVINLAGVNTRQVITIPAALIPATSSFTGSVVTPKTYLIYKVASDASPIRLRLYTSASLRDVATEASRSFLTEPGSGSGLIADFYMEDTATVPLSPIVMGRNDNDLVNLNVSPTAESYYRMTNESATGTVSASVFVFSLED